ncbi:MAG TPA: metal-dependent transcriptional regulator [Candidatus Anaerotruncus excrementipullorum]|uniref:Metal-dependent transcriptional regulator n=1 Tax=Candidatus Anaerotruncus excrementipullorum TaxID=2838465 RepID=A0A9D1WPU6_9FIRM|nr:metal-dependent transcriptional regulator [Candidatus Anaerotruncus excrementipullorum]
MQIHESAEDYLEAILAIKEEKGLVRSVDVAQRLGVSKPSVSRAMGLLRENGYITMGREGWLELTPAGYEIADRIYERHRILSRWLASLGVPEEVAAQDACRMEHDISAITFQRLKEHILANSQG